MCLLKDMNFRTTENFVENEWGNLHLGKDGLCTAVLTWGNLEVYLHVDGDGVLRKDNTRLDYQAIQMSPDLLDTIEESNAVSATALTKNHGYTWEDEPRIVASLEIQRDEDVQQVTLAWDERKIYSPLWCKYQLIQLLQDSKTSFHNANVMTAEEILELEEIRGITYRLKRNHSNAFMERDIQEVLDENPDLFNLLKHVECYAGDNQLTVLWQSNDKEVHNEMNRLMTKWK